ncbi:hypothetical protein PVAP13_6NG287825 [Panicum virgatum]|uniref:Uncharacterized protein n=1 Tax=Panicum virgatum TaxID=38727 RepID=A0A8T0R2I6_PANVG|nr:hypothetical protein PVAP13_6NG287825 [Panicum virgatum]
MHAASACYGNRDMGNMVAAGPATPAKAAAASSSTQDRGRVRQQRRRVPEHHRPLQAGLRQDRQPRRRRGQGRLQLRGLPVGVLESSRMSHASFETTFQRRGIHIQIQTCNTYARQALARIGCLNNARIRATLIIRIYIPPLSDILKTS